MRPPRYALEFGQPGHPCGRAEGLDFAFARAKTYKKVGGFRVLPVLDTPSGPEDSPLILAGTGHRPPRLGLDYSDTSRLTLREFVRPHLQRLSPSKVISGGALGFDQALAEAALDLDIPLSVALPFKSMGKNWPETSRQTLRGILDRAEVVIAGKGFGSQAFLTRDVWMVENCTHLLALHDGGSEGGTAYTAEYARSVGRPVTDLWDAWGCLRGK